ERHGLALPAPRRLEAHAAAAGLARRAFVDELDARALERGDQLHQRLDVAADHAVARLHALDGGQREARRLGERRLVEAGVGPRANASPEKGPSGWGMPRATSAFTNAAAVATPALANATPSEPNTRSMPPPGSARDTASRPSKRPSTSDLAPAAVVSIARFKSAALPPCCCVHQPAASRTITLMSARSHRHCPTSSSSSRCASTGFSTTPAMVFAMEGLRRGMLQALCPVEQHAAARQRLTSGKRRISVQVHPSKDGACRAGAFTCGRSSALFASSETKRPSRNCYGCVPRHCAVISAAKQGRLTMSS